MKVKTSTGTILESSNEFVINQWKKNGYKEVSGRKSKEKPEENPEDAPESKNQGKE